MKITIINRKNQEDTVRTFNKVNVSAEELIEALWNKPEIHKSVFSGEKKLLACIDQATVQDHIKGLLKSEDDGDVKLNIKKIKHDGEKKYLGITLIGKKQGFGGVWHEAIIDQEVFLKRRRELKPDDVIPEMIIKLQRKNVRKSIRVKIKEAAHTKAEEQAKDSLRPEEPSVPPVTNDPVIIEPVSDPNAQNGSGEPDKPEDNAKKGWFGNLFKHPIFHGAVAGLVTGAALFFAKVATWILAASSIGIAVLTWGIESLYFWRKREMEEGYEAFDKMSPTEISKLSPEVKHALNAGLEAKSTWTKSVFDTNAWKNHRAWYAAYKASENEDDHLAKKIKLKAKVA